MKLDPKATAYAGGAVWGLSVLLVGLVNLSFPDYGREFLELVGSVYPGYNVDRTLGEVLIATGYGMVDGAIGGWLIAFLYNRLVVKQK